MEGFSVNKQNHLDRIPLAKLNEQQLQHLQQMEQELNQEGKGVYLIAFSKEADLSSIDQ
jgi:penicillin-binding protein-related factor A (putative recombinase)